MRFLLDSDICVFWRRGRASVQEHLLAVKPEAIAISAITLAELRYGADCSNQPDGNHEAIDDFISAITVLGTESTIARHFGKIKAPLRQQGLLLEDFDLLIAATALAHNLVLVTNNTKHFRRIPNLRLENWV